MSGSKKTKGAVTITQDRGRIRLRWRFSGQRYSINHSCSGEINLPVAKKLALQIAQDMILRQFDTALQKYTGKVNPVKKAATDFTGTFEHWVTNYKQSDCDVHTNYNSTRNMIRQWGKVESSNVLQKLNSIQNAAVTYNRRLTILRSYIDCWCSRRFGTPIH